VQRSRQRFARRNAITGGGRPWTRRCAQSRRTRRGSSSICRQIAGQSG
jgi:hypothetical protein